MQYIIKGQQSLAGTVTVGGAKNAALKLIIAALLTKGVSTITNVPRLRDVMALLEIINYLGGEAKFTDRHTVTIENKLTRYQLPLEAAARTRVSIMLLAPLLHQFNQAVVPNPGGCRLGERSVNRLIESLSKMGATIRYHSQDGYYYGKLSQAHPSRIVFPKKSHTGTELAIMFASRIPGATMIENAAMEPEINDLITFLNRAGATIIREGEKIIVKGLSQLKATAVKVQPDRIEAVTFIILSALFAGRIKVKNVGQSAIQPFLVPFQQAGFNCRFDRQNTFLTVTTPPTIKPTQVTTAPHPGFLTDWQPIWTLLMTKAHGESSVHETVFENRLGYVSDLRRFGAKIKFYQPKVTDPEQTYQFNGFDRHKHRRQAIKIVGPTLLHNAYATMPDIRAGACLVLASLIAKGTSVINQAEQIDRGYEDLVGKLTKLGAKIELKR